MPCIITEHTRGCETFSGCKCRHLQSLPLVLLRALNHSPPHILNTSTHPYPAHPPSPPSAPATTARREQAESCCSPPTLTPLPTRRTTEGTILPQPLLPRSLPCLPIPSLPTERFKNSCFQEAWPPLPTLTFKPLKLQRSLLSVRRGQALSHQPRLFQVPTKR